jgi:hypothetical protein
MRKRCDHQYLAFSEIRRVKPFHTMGNETEA